MFSKAKRFDYYPKPEVLPSPRCERCSKSDNHSMTSAGCRSSVRKTPDSPAFRRTRSLGPATRNASKNRVSFNEAPETPKTHEQQFEQTNVTFVAPNLIQRNESPATSSDEGFQTSNLELSKHLVDIEAKIENHRQKVWQLRRRHFEASLPSSDDGFLSSRSVSPGDLTAEERLSHVENISKLCVKETLEFVTMCNKQQEVLPQHNQRLVESCSNLVRQVARQERNTWKKMMKVFKKAVKSFKK